MKILIFEWLNSGGLWLDGVTPDPDCSMQRQGFQMMSAIADDFSLGGFEIATLIDARMARTLEYTNWDNRLVGETDSVCETLLEIGKKVDHVLIIAPETESILVQCLDWLNPIEEKILNPGRRFTQLTSNKQKTFEYCKANGFESFPDGYNYQKVLNDSKLVDLWSGPLVLKPIDGAGSDEVQLIHESASQTPTLSREPDQYRIEQFVPGVPVSVSVLCGEAYELLAPTIQTFDQPLGHYVGAEYPIDEAISQRAIKLAATVMKSLPKTRGYVGLDLVIGESDGQPNDKLIEVNPRLTTSYLRLREIYHETHRENLAMRMLETAIEPMTNSPITCTFRERSL